MLAKSAASFAINSAITPPLSFQQPLVPAPVPQTESGNESSPFSDLPWLLHPCQPAAQSHAPTGSSQPLGDGRQKCRPHVDRNRIPDSHEFSLKKTPGPPLLRLPPLGKRKNETGWPPTVSKNVRVPSGQDREC